LRINPRGGNKLHRVTLALRSAEKNEREQKQLEAGDAENSTQRHKDAKKRKGIQPGAASDQAGVDASLNRLRGA
jgi:hypothetical protein